jgi:hypothetical protein
MEGNVISTVCPNMLEEGGEVLLKLDSTCKPSGIICRWYNGETKGCNVTAGECMYQRGWMPLE